MPRKSQVLAFLTQSYTSIKNSRTKTKAIIFLNHNAPNSLPISKQTVILCCENPRMGGNQRLRMFSLEFHIPVR